MKVIDLAFLLNRSVILPSFMANTIEISDGLCVFPHDGIWNGNGFASVFEMPAGNLTQTIRSQHNGLVPIHCVAKDSLKFGLSQARIITMWNEFFFTRIPLSHHREMMKHIHPSARITEAALAYMEHVGLMHDGIAEHFVGIHLRNFGSDCHEVMNLTYFTSPKEVFERINSTCSMSWSYLTNILKEYGLEANATKVYVSSDGQRPQIDAELNAHKNVYSLLKFRTEEGEATTRIIPPDIHEGIFEMVILSYSSLFLGQPYSSFSLNAQWWREARGFTNPSQVYFPSYSDTEAHGHPIYELEEVNKP